MWEDRRTKLIGIAGALEAPSVFRRHITPLSFGSHGNRWWERSLARWPPTFASVPTTVFPYTHLASMYQVFYSDPITHVLDTLAVA